MRFLKGRPLNLSRAFFEDDEETPLTVGSVSVVLTDPQGTEIDTASATLNGTAWDVTFPAQPLGVYVAMWDTGTFVEDQRIEIVGNFLFSVPDARESDEDLADATRYPAAEIIHYRGVVEEEFQRICSRSFTTRVKEVEFRADNSGEYDLLIPDFQGVEAVWLNGAPVDDFSGYVVDGVSVQLPSPVRCDDTIKMQVRYGFATPPDDVKRAGMIRLRSLLAAEDSGIPDRATTWQPQEGGTFRLATAGQGKWRTGIPEVDTVLRDYSLDIVMSVFLIG